MRTEVRIFSGSLRGRKLTFTIDPDLRPMPDRVRHALFSILGNAVPGRQFFDLFAGTGAVGMEALSREAGRVTFVELDAKLSGALTKYMQEFRVADRTTIYRGDVYRWVQHWPAPAEPVTIFLGPPFPHLENRLDALIQTLSELQQRVAFDSVLAFQSEKGFDVSKLPDPERWDHRKYGRNILSIWVKEQVGI